LDLVIRRDVEMLRRNLCLEVGMVPVDRAGVGVTRAVEETLPAPPGAIFKTDGNDDVRGPIVCLKETPNGFFTILGNSTHLGAPYRGGAVREADLRR
jgi:hypothetical protein